MTIGTFKKPAPSLFRGRTAALLLLIPVFSACKWLKVGYGLTKSEAQPTIMVDGMAVAAPSRDMSVYGHLAQGNKLVLRCPETHTKLFTWNMPASFSKPTGYYSLVGSGEYKILITGKENQGNNDVEHVVHAFDAIGNQDTWTYDESLALPSFNSSAHDNFVEDTYPIAVMADSDERPWVLVRHGSSFDDSPIGDNNSGIWLYRGTHYSGELSPAIHLSGIFNNLPGMGPMDIARRSMTFDSVTGEIVLAMLGGGGFPDGLFDMRLKYYGSPQTTNWFEVTSIEFHSVPVGNLLGYGSFAGITAAMIQPSSGAAVLVGMHSGRVVPIATTTQSDLVKIGGFGLSLRTSPTYEIEAFAFATSSKANFLAHTFQLKQ
jgi:hypothetical protein